MGLLDQNSYSFSDPESRELFDMLVGLYGADRARSLALRIRAVADLFRSEAGQRSF